MEEQINIFDYAAHQDEHAGLTCSKCICHTCNHRQGRGCHYGYCYDDKRKKEKPYTDYHDKPVTLMSNWERYLDQWCKDGIFYPSHICEYYERGTPTVINGAEFW